VAEKRKKSGQPVKDKAKVCRPLQDILSLLSDGMVNLERRVAAYNKNSRCYESLTSPEGPTVGLPLYAYKTSLIDGFNSVDTVEDMQEVTKHFGNIAAARVFQLFAHTQAKELRKVVESLADGIAELMHVIDEIDPKLQKASVATDFHAYEGENDDEEEEE